LPHHIIATVCSHHRLEIFYSAIFLSLNQLQSLVKILCITLLAYFRRKLRERLKLFSWVGDARKI